MNIAVERTLCKELERPQTLVLSLFKVLFHMYMYMYMYMYLYVYVYVYV